MLKPSEHSVYYDVDQYQIDKKMQFNGNVLKLAQKPRYWQVTVTVKTTNGVLQDVDSIPFRPTSRVKLGEIASLINDYIFGLDFIGKCVSCKVCARVMTEGGV